MKYISLGNNCFWGNVSDELNQHYENSTIFRMSTSLLSNGGIYFYYKAKIKICIPKIICTYILIVKVFNKKLKTTNIIKYSRKLKNNKICTFYAYKLFKYLIFPCFEFHSINKSLNINSNYSNFLADIYVYGGKLKNTILNRFFIRKIYTFLCKYNKNCKLIVFSPFKLTINYENIICILLNTNNCYNRLERIQYAIEKNEYDILCHVFNHKFKFVKCL